MKTLPQFKTYLLNQLDLQVLKKKIIILLATNHSKPSNSLYGAPTLFTKKKDGFLHICIDYHALNEQTITDSYLLPYTDKLLTRLKGAQYFSKLDLYIINGEVAQYMQRMLPKHVIEPEIGSTTAGSIRPLGTTVDSPLEFLNDKLYAECRMPKGCVTNFCPVMNSIGVS